MTAVALTAVNMPAGGWQSTGSQDTGRAQMEMAARTGDILVEPGVMFAQDPYSVVIGTNATVVGIPITGGSSGFANADGAFTFNSSLTTMTEFRTYRYWRPVWIVKNSGTTDRTSARVAGVVELWHS